MLKKILCALLLGVMLGGSGWWSGGRSLQAQSVFAMELANQEAATQPHTIYLPLVMKLPPGDDTVPGEVAINIPYDVEEPERAIFWFGTVNPDTNYVDVRTRYSNDALEVYLAIFDRRLWTDTSPSPETLMDWDAASLYLDLDGRSQKAAPDGHSYRFDVQFFDHDNPANHPEDNSRTWQGNGSAWSEADVMIGILPGWRGIEFNDNEDDKGWAMTYTIPFASLGLSGRPADGQIWRMALAVHNRNDAAGSISIPLTVWPDASQFTRPETWGRIRFGLPGYTPPPVNGTGQVTIRHKLNGAVVTDAEVGGGGSCGGNPANYWTEWGNSVTEPENRSDFSVQNQTDISDWPCFAKSFITFPLSQIPAGKVIVSATLTLHHIGNSTTVGPPPPTASLIQIMRVTGEWDQETITWNTAPQAIDNVAQTWVTPRAVFPNWPKIPYNWDVSRAVAEAYAEGQPLRLGVYSAASQYHSGIYFSGSSTGDWNAAGRPTLTITWGNP